MAAAMNWSSAQEPSKHRDGHVVGNGDLLRQGLRVVDGDLDVEGVVVGEMEIVTEGEGEELTKTSS